ncbi:hypothetical protein VAE122_2980353 [Vibrio aestuarianus]|nr:hypothetical protein VAE122_2980353 [Vibrio aestuarianus]
MSFVNSSPIKARQPPVPNLIIISSFGIHYNLLPNLIKGANIPFLLAAAVVLATFAHPNHIVYLCSWGETHLLPTCNFKCFGYRVVC